MTFRADETICPAHALKILGAGIVVRKNALEFRETCWKAAGIHCWMLETRLGLSSNRIGKVYFATGRSTHLRRRDCRENCQSRAKAHRTPFDSVAAIGGA